MQTLTDCLAALADRYGLRDIHVFGSRAEELGARLRGKTGDGADASSDVDIAVQPGAGIDLSAPDRVRIAAELDDLLEVPRVDLMVLPEASPFLRASWVREMVGRLRSLPLESLEAFTSDPHTPAAAESYLRRALEAVMDLGRHILSKAFGVVPAEYKEIAERLGEVGMLSVGARRRGSLTPESLTPRVPAGWPVPKLLVQPFRITGIAGGA